MVKWLIGQVALLIIIVILAIAWQGVAFFFWGTPFSPEGARQGVVFWMIALNVIDVLQRLGGWLGNAANNDWR